MMSSPADEHYLEKFVMCVWCFFLVIVFWINLPKQPLNTSSFPLFLTSLLSKSFCFCCRSGRRCRSTMWRQACSTRGTIWVARCRTVTVMCWPASLWRSLMVRLLSKFVLLMFNFHFKVPTSHSSSKAKYEQNKKKMISFCTSWRKLKFQPVEYS